MVLPMDASSFKSSRDLDAGAGPDRKQVRPTTKFAARGSVRVPNKNAAASRATTPAHSLRVCPKGSPNPTIRQSVFSAVGREIVTARIKIQILPNIHILIHAEKVGHVTDEIMQPALCHLRFAVDPDFARGRFSNPASIRRVVVLPAPLRPIKPKSTPRGTCKFRWSTASVFLNFLVRLRFQLQRVRLSFQS